MSDRVVKCSAAGRFRDRHMATDHQYHLTAPDGQQFVFCLSACLLEYTVWGLPADIRLLKGAELYVEANRSDGRPDIQVGPELSPNPTEPVRNDGRENDPQQPTQHPHTPHGDDDATSDGEVAA